MKTHRWLPLACLVAAAGLFLASDRATAEGDTKGIVYVVDVSGSMAPVLGNVSRAICENVETEKIKPLQKSLVLFEGCGIETARVAVPLAKDNTEAIKTAAKGMRAGGATDILAGLARAKEVIQGALERTGDCAHVVLFTDDEDTCGNGKKHFDVIKDMKTACAEKKAVFSLDVVTSAKDEETLLFLEKLANSGDGKVHGVVSVDEIGETLQRILDQRRRKTPGSPQTTTAQKPDTSNSTQNREPTATPQQKPLPAQQGGGSNPPSAPGEKKP